MIMLEFIKSSVTLLIIVTPIVYFLLKWLFKNSVFQKIGLIWVVSAIMASLNSEAKVLFDDYSRAVAIPVNTIILAGAIYWASLIVKVPLKEMINDLVKLTKGNLGINITDKYKSRKDELGTLANSINELTLNLDKMISSMKLNSVKQSNISQSMNTIANSLTNSTSAQASSIEEISATMEEIASNISMNSDNSVKTEKNTLKTIETIEEGSNSSLKSVETIKQVAEKVQLINDVAFQTNILALNAAVEASHAGDAGKGFAVVANEVKKLAERSNQAAQEIESVSANVLRMAESSRSQFQNIISEAGSTAELIKEITSNSLEQNVNVQQINDSVQSLNRMVQTNTTEVDKINSLAGNLSETANEMNGLINYFTLRK